MLEFSYRKRLIIIYICVKGQITLLNQMQRPKCRHAFTDRPGLEKSGRCHRGLAALVGKTIDFFMILLP
jgi:hypothetical protein